MRAKKQIALLRDCVDDLRERLILLEQQSNQAYVELIDADKKIDKKIESAVKLNNFNPYDLNQVGKKKKKRPRTTRKQSRSDDPYSASA